MPTNTAFFVQFPHPGGEHVPSGAEMPWNTGSHRRKFLVSPGWYDDGNGRSQDGELVFWGEWEPPSRVERRWPAQGRLPRVLHRPFWSKASTDAFRQNTDPWVFGDNMIYSNCKQVTGIARRPTSMQALNRGSIVCFGSTNDNQFCVDTVLVVASAEHWTPNAYNNLDVEEAFRVCTGASMAAVRTDAHNSLTLFRGATLENPVEGMYSFAPARRAGDQEPRFARPPVTSTFIKPASRQSTWGSKRPLTIDKLQSEWESLRNQVLARDLLLAVHLQTPSGGRESITVPSSSRERC